MDDSAHDLIQKLLANPSRFNKSGEAYSLLQAYFAGHPVETLRQLLLDKNVLVQRSAAFIASELGAYVCTLIDDIVPLATSQDGHTAWYAIEILTVCSIGNQASKFVHVVRALESEDDGLRRLAMRMVCSADMSQLQAAQSCVEPQSPHATGLAVLTNEVVKPEELVLMVRGSVPLLRRYGAIGVKRLEQRWPQLLTELDTSDDRDVYTLNELMS